MADSTTPVKRPLEPQKRAIVIGASSGIGAALVRRLALQGYRVAALARREEELATISARRLTQLSRTAAEASVLVYAHDVTDSDVVPALFQDIVRDLGGLDLIVYVAGTQPAVAAE